MTQSEQVNITPPARHDELRQRLETFGDPRKSHRWNVGDPDYVAALDLTLADVPQLLATARLWAERTDWPKDENDLSVFSSIHAWRALGQLHAAEAAPTLIGMMDPLQERNDDWHQSEFPDVFGLIGPAPLDLLEAHLRDTSHNEWSRICAADAMERIATRHGEMRSRVVAVLNAVLNEFAENTPSFNALLVSRLMELKAVEAADAIERAHAADCVDTTVCGNWNTVREEMGLEDHGLVPPKIAGAAIDPFRYMKPKTPAVSKAPAVSHTPSPTSDRDRHRIERNRNRRSRKRRRR